MNVQIVGGGIAGLATAIAFAQRGHKVRVLEQAFEFQHIGAGLQISPNGWKVLEALDVTRAVQERMFEPEAIEMRVGTTGAQIFRLPLRDIAHDRWDGRYIHIHRAHLHAALLDKLQTLAPDAVEMGSRVDGHVGECDLTVGADGLHSGVRRRMFGGDAPRYTGNLAWRCVVPAAELGADLPPPCATVWVGHNRHAVTTWLDGGKLVNFVGMVERSAPSEEGWDVAGTQAEALADFAGWNPVIHRIVAAANPLNRWALFDRPALPQWHRDATVLVGDAAHPMLPSMAQGAVQALEDAWTLAALADRLPLDQALPAFHAKRGARTARIQRVSAQNARLFHQDGLVGRTALYGPMALVSRLFPNLLHARQDWVYGHDPIAAAEN